MAVKMKMVIMLDSSLTLRQFQGWLLLHLPVGLAGGGFLLRLSPQPFPASNDKQNPFEQAPEGLLFCCVEFRGGELKVLCLSVAVPGGPSDRRGLSSP